jgi:hypothetical protein
VLIFFKFFELFEFLSFGTFSALAGKLVAAVGLAIFTLYFVLRGAHGVRMGYFEVVQHTIPYVEFFFTISLGVNFRVLNVGFSAEYCSVNLLKTFIKTPETQVVLRAEAHPVRHVLRHCV